MSPFTFPLINKTRTPASSLRARSKTHLRNLKERWQQGYYYLLDTAEMVDASDSTALAKDFLLRKPNRRLRGPARLARPAVYVRTQAEGTALLPAPLPSNLRAKIPGGVANPLVSCIPVKRCDCCARDGMS